MATYDSLRRQARTLESVLESKMSAYSRLGMSLSKPGGDLEIGRDTERWDDLESEVEGLLEKVRVRRCWAEWSVG